MLQAQGLTSHDARHVQPVDCSNGHKDQYQLSAKNHHQQDHEKHERHGVEHIDDAHHDVVHPAAKIAGGGPVGDADQQAHNGCHHADHEGHATAVERAHKKIATDAIGAEV